MRGLDLFAGIGGASIAVQRAGIEVVAHAEIEPFCCRVLEHRFPDIPNYGDVSKIDPAELVENHGPIDLVSFGSPCQDWSVAGKRLGLKGHRSSLFHEAIRIVRGVRPAFAVFENVPGLFSSAGGWDFAAVLDEMAESGALDIAWRVLDAQWFGVPQRRRRIFLIADFRGERAGEILSLSQGVFRHPAPSREAGEEAAGSSGDGTPFTVRNGARAELSGERTSSIRGEGGSGRDYVATTASTLGGGTGQRGWADDTDRMTFIPEVAPDSRSNFHSDHDGDESRLIPEVAGGQPTRYGKGANSSVDDGALVVQGGAEQDQFVSPEGISPTLAHSSNSHQGHHQPKVMLGFTEHGEGSGGSDDKSPAITTSHGQRPAVAFAENQRAEIRTSEVHPQLTGGGGKAGQGYPAVAFTERTRADGRNFEYLEEQAYALANPGSGGRTHSRQLVQGMAVRRLTPTECEKLQGFPEVEKTVKIRVWQNSSGQARNPASVATQSHRSPKSASNVDDGRKPGSALSAENPSASDQESRNERAAVDVLISCEGRTLEFRSQGKCLLLVNSVGGESSSPLPMQIEDFVRRVVLMTTIQDQITHAGRAASQTRTEPSSRQGGGSSIVEISGQEIERLASNAESVIQTANRDSTSTTSDHGLSFPNSDLVLKILSSSVVHAISGFIPAPTQSAPSYDLNLITSFGWTEILRASDSARYRALGNAWAVPVGEWVMRRIAEVADGSL